MPINKETIISVFDDKLTLMQWLKTINKALEDAVLTGVEINKKGNATLSFKFTFEDGTYLETNDVVLQQGESVNGAYIQNGHLYLTLTNGTNLDAGNVKPVSNFSIDANQHLIVNYADGTSQDLGAIFNGSVSISGTLNVGENVAVTGFINAQGEVNAGGNINSNQTIFGDKVQGNEIIERMAGYSFVSDTSDAERLIDNIYASVVKTGNKLTFVWFFAVTRLLDAVTGNVIGSFAIPQSVADKLYPFSISGLYYLDNRKVDGIQDDFTRVSVNMDVTKTFGTRVNFILFTSDFTKSEKTYVRVEQTFLLSENMAE